MEIAARVKQAAEAGKGRIWSAAAELYSKGLKNGRQNKGFSTRLNYDWRLHRPIAHRLHIGLDTSDESGGYVFSLRSQTDSISAGYGISHYLAENLFASLHAEGWYSLTRSKYVRGAVSARARIESAGGSVSSRIQGSYQLSRNSWLDLMLAYTRAREAIQDKDIVITAPSYQSLDHLLLSEPETIRLSLEPVLRIKLPIISEESQNLLKFTPSYQCEKMKSNTLFRKCNEGMRLDLEVVSKDEDDIARLNYDYQDLSSGPVHEFGMAMDMKF